jgi:D-glycero-D-manno-heptose 1,7-bisphosphate phosphatase
MMLKSQIISFDYSDAVVESDHDVVFLDRDGVLLEVVEREGDWSSARSEDEIKFCEDAGLMPSHSGDGKKLVYIVVSNQPDISRGLIDVDFLKVCSELIAANSLVKRFIYCPHLNEHGCKCRKPRSGMFLFASAKYAFSLDKAIYIGDRLTDFEVAQSIGIPFGMIVRNHNRDYNNSTLFNSDSTLPNLVRSFLNL